MRVLGPAVVIVALLCACGPAVVGQTNPTGTEVAAPDDNWEAAAKAEGLTPEDIAKLRGDKLLVSNETFRQVFDPYIQGREPLFITSDSLLNGFHVLYEESVLRMEKANARKLPEILRFIWAKLPTVGTEIKGKPERVSAARSRAQIIIATALKLCGDKTIAPPAEMGKLIDEEVKRIEAAEGRLKPAWLGPPDAGFAELDYTRYKPRGFYTKSESLQRYFRAVSWLQSIPFRVSKDDELLAILMLGRTVTYEQFGEDFAKGEEFENFFRGFSRFIGVDDDWDIMTAAHEAQHELDFDFGADGLAEKRKEVMEAAEGDGEGPRINDQLRFAPSDASKTAEANFRILSAYRTPDAVLFQRTTGFGGFDRFPSGLDVCSALGSTFAASKLADKDREKLLKRIDESKPLFAGGSLYFDYLDCLRALLGEPEPDAPPFMKNDAWKTKSCQTALGGWAQLRHTWALQAKQTVEYLGLTMPPTGFVEPNPEFFARMGRLADKTEDLLKASGAMEPDIQAMAAEIRATADLIRKKDFANKGQEAFQEVFKALSQDEQMSLETVMYLLMALKVTPDFENPKKFWTEAEGKLAQLADDLGKGVMPADPALARMLRQVGFDISPLWRRFGDTCRRLEALAHKQLRGVPFSGDEDRFLKDYGTLLAGIMLYGGNSYLTPRDDAPRAVDVFYNPNAAKCLEVGVGRPRALYVLYPVKGREVLAKGAVMPYYEFPHATRLTDAEWKTLLDSDKRPDLPAWVKPIVGTGEVRKPAED